MEHRILPGTLSDTDPGLSFSVVTLGLWAIGGKYWGDDVRDETSIAAIHEALDLGIDSFDTAPLYGEGHADEVLVKALGERRHTVTIATKVGVRTVGGHARSDLSPAHLRADCEASLTRLKLERIDLLQVHWPCEVGTPLEASLSTLVALQAEGKIAHFGLSNYDAQTLAKARALAGLVSLQTPYSLLRREYERSLEAACGPGPDAAPPLGVLAYEPLCRGLLTGKFGPESRFPESDLRHHDERFRGGAYRRALRLAEGLAAIAAHFEASAAALAIAWVLRRPTITTALVGAKRAEQVRQNAEAARLLQEPGIPWETLDRMAEAVHPSPREA